MARAKLQRLTEQMYYILLSLLEEDRHGYSIMQAVLGITQGAVVIGAGTLYTLLARFEGEKIIEKTAEEDNRKTYKITPYGCEILQNEYERLCQQVKDGAANLGRDMHV